MGAFAVVSILCAALSGVTSVSGVVVDSSGAAVAGARVFLEPAYEAALVQTTSGTDGSWNFEGPYQGVLGVFGWAPGLAYGGATVSAGMNDSIRGVRIVLHQPASISGKILDSRKRPVENARITRIALLGATKVGIPLAKLRAYGLNEPASDGDGRFTLEMLPQDHKAALKVAHPAYAQDAVNDVPVGAGSVEVVLHEGLLLEGQVLTASGAIPVADAPVMIRSANPPHDTAVTTTNTSGVFALRLKPGEYMCQVASPGLRSAGWLPLTMDPARPIPRPMLYVAGAGSIRGNVCDAVTGKPVDGARLYINTQGNAAAAARTGASGEFKTNAMAGENHVKLERVPGYVMPEQTAFTVQVVEGRETVLPTFWLAPLPSHDVLVIDPEGAPVAGAVLTLLRPYQFGWRVTGQDGLVNVTITEMPEDGTVIGMVEHVSQPWGALFAIPRGYRDVATVQLFPLATVRGQVTTERGAGVEGAIVAALFGEYDLPLWRVVAGRRGFFQYESVIPQVPQACVAYAGDEPNESPARFAIEAGGEKDLGALTVVDSQKSDSLMGKNLPWPQQRTVPSRRTGPAVVIYCAPDEADMVVEGLAEAKRVIGRGDIEFAAIVDGMAAPQHPEVTVLSGKAPGAATTYVTGPDGKVVLETFGLPPLRGLQAL